MILETLQKCKPLGQTPKKWNSFDLQKEYCAPGTQTRIVDIDNRFCQEIEKAFCAAMFTRTLCIRTLHVPNEINSAIILPTIRLNARHIVNSLSYFTLVWNVISVLVEMANLAIVKIDNFCKNKMIALQFKFCDENDAGIIFSKTQW